MTVYLETDIFIEKKTVKYFTKNEIVLQKVTQQTEFVYVAVTERTL